MNEKLNAHCKICGKGYHICNSCKTSRFLPWRSIVDTAQHYKIYMILRDYTNRSMNKLEARKQLEKLDLSERESFLTEVKAAINEILSDRESQA